MKLSEFYDKPKNKSKKPQILAFNNEVKEAQMTAKVVDLEAKLAFVETQMADKVVISRQLEEQRAATQELVTNLEKNKLLIASLEAQIQEKHRILGEIDGLKRSNDQLMTSHGEMTASLTTISTAFHNQGEELENLRGTNASLDITRQSLFNESLTKNTLLQELKVTLADLKEKHEALTSSSDALGRQYTEMMATKESLDKNNLALHTSMLLLQKEQEESKSKEKYNIERNTEAVETRTRGTMNKQTEELQQDVKDLVKLTAYYRTELSKPQHLSIGAIARQEGFKIPLASSAINYRKNNLGTGKPTLLKFGAKESS
jgi:chromosome segregation ATPase